MDNFDLRKYLAEGKLLKEEYEVGDIVLMRGDELKGEELTIDSKRRMFGSKLNAYTVKKSNGETAEYDETQLVAVPTLDADYEFHDELDSLVDEFSDEDDEATKRRRNHQAQSMDLDGYVDDPSNPLGEPVMENVINVPLADYYDFADEAKFVQEFLDSTGIETTVRVGRDGLDITYSQYEDKNDLEQTLNNRGYEWDYYTQSNLYEGKLLNEVRGPIEKIELQISKGEVMSTYHLDQYGFDENVDGVPIEDLFDPTGRALRDMSIVYDQRGSMYLMDTEDITKYH